MLTQIITFLIFFAVIGCILYGRRLIKTEKVDAVFGNPERALGGTHWVIVGSSFLLLIWLYYSWDIAKGFYPKSANELCQVGKVNDSLLGLKYQFPINERELKSTSQIKQENKNLKKILVEIQNSQELDNQQKLILVSFINKTNKLIPLLTNEDFSTPSRTLNVTNTFDELLKHENVIPIINENDSVATEELKFGDNDSLSASLSILINASLLIILTEVDGLMDAHGNLIPHIDDINDAMNHVRLEKGKYSVGGMATKLEAASMASRSGITTLIANGRRTNQLEDLVNGEGVFTKISIGNE